MARAGCSPRWLRLVPLWLTLLCGTPAAAEAPHFAPVDVRVLDRPPYYEVVDGVPGGFLLLRAQAVLARAGIPVDTYEALPPRRILALLRQNASPLCSVGWFRTAEREAYARYSLPIHVDRPHLVLAHRRVAAAVERKRTLLALMDDPDLRLGLVDGFTYGVHLDAMIAARHGPVDAGVPSAARLLDKLASGRVDFVLLDQEEATYLLATQHPADAVAVTLGGMPPGPKRYLICSQQVPPDTMAAIDRAIQAVVAPPVTSNGEHTKSRRLRR